MDRELSFELVDVGDKVKHPEFKDGVVTLRIGDGLNAKVVVKFQPGIGEKKLALRYARLKKIQDRPTLAAAEGDGAGEATGETEAKTE